MKKILILFLTLFFITGCYNKINFENIKKDTSKFYKINVAEKIDGGIL